MCGGASINIIIIHLRIIKEEKLNKLSFKWEVYHQKENERSKSNRDGYACMEAYIYKFFSCGDKVCMSEKCLFMEPQADCLGL